MKLIASDYDKTFHRHDAQDLKSNINAVENWRKKGNIFVISTGRDVASMLHEKKIRQLGYDYIVALDGSLVVDSDNKVLFKQCLHDKLARELVALLQTKCGNDLIISNGFDGYNMANKTASLTCGVAKEIYERNLKIYSKSIESALAGEVLLIACLNDNIDKAIQLQQDILLKYGAEVEVFINFRYINIVAKGISKASGIEVLMDHTGIDKDCISAIGDDLNDMPMLDKFNGYAVNNAKAEVKAISLKTYNSVSELIIALS